MSPRRAGRGFSGHSSGPTLPALPDLFALWDAIYGPEVGYLGLFSCLRPEPAESAQPRQAEPHVPGAARHPGHHQARPGPPGRSPRVTDPRQRFFPYPLRAEEAARWCHDASASGRDAFYCAHLLTARRRVKENAAPVRALWAEADGEEGENLSAAPPPTAIVESSPGRRHVFWRLMRPLDGPDAEILNRRLAHATGADPSGWDLSQMTRPPGTRNRKYSEAPPVRLLSLDAGVLYHPRELDLALPELPEPMNAPKPGRPLHPTGGAPGGCVAVDLSRLSGRMRDLAHHGQPRGAGAPYATRSEAAFAVAVAMFGKGYSRAEVSSVLLDHTLGISEKAREQGRHSARWAALTVDRSESAAQPADPALVGR